MSGFLENKERNTQTHTHTLSKGGREKERKSLGEICEREEEPKKKHKMQKQLKLSPAQTKKLVNWKAEYC